MPDLILHHYDISPYSEKIRLIMGLKGLRWRSVRIPMVMPKLRRTDARAGDVVVQFPREGCMTLAG